MAKTVNNRIFKSLSAFFLPYFQVFQYLFKRYAGYVVFLVIPVIYLINISMIHYGYGAFFMSRIDPEYFYMYNGVVLGAGNLSVQYYAHPGTPLHYLIAISSRIIDLFQPGDYMKSFVDDPERYIHAANLFLNVLIAIVLAFCGLYAKKFTGSYFAALFFQVSPFSSASLLTLQGRVFPEAIMMIPLLLTGLMVIKYIFTENDEKNTSRDLIIFGIITGFGIACKLTFIPIILIPLILLKTSVKQKFLLLLYTLLSFVIFAYPVIFNFHEFWNWTSGIFTHSGKYGSGARDIIDFTQVPGNMKELLINNKGLFYTALGSLLLITVARTGFYRSASQEQRRIMRAILAVNAGLIVSALLILKHFSLYYFTPFAIFTFLLIVLSFLLVFRFKKVLATKPLRIAIVFLFALMITFMAAGQVKAMRSMIGAMDKKEAVLQHHRAMIKSMVDPEKPIIITAPFYGSPFIEFAQFNGFIMSSRLKGFYKSYLKEKYPNCYIYVTWSNKFNYWSDFVSFSDILKKGSSSFYIYIGKDRAGDLPVIEDRLWRVVDRDSASVQILYRDPASGEELIQISLLKI